MTRTFAGVEISDPNDIIDYVDSCTASVASVFESLNSVLYNDDPNLISPTDFEAAASLPYDTDIPSRKF